MKENNSENGHGNDVFVLVEHYYPKEGHLEDMMKITLDSAKGIKGFSGLIQSQVLRPTITNGPIVNISIWESKNKFQSFMQSDQMKEVLQSDELGNMKNWSEDIKAEMYSLETGWHN